VPLSSKPVVSPFSRWAIILFLGRTTCEPGSMGTILHRQFGMNPRSEQ